MAKVDPGLKDLATMTPSPRVAASLRPVRDLAAAPRSANVMVELRDESPPADLLALGFVPRTRAGTVLTGDIPIDAIARLENIPGLKRAEKSRALHRELDVALPEARIVAVHNASPARRGAGVIVAIVDRGIDYQHPSFRKADGTSRILAIWDQRLEPVPGEASPAGFNYGVEYTQAAIDAALQSSAPRLMVRHADIAPFHGTHVAGIAAGNGQPGAASGAPGPFVGVAPEADLVVVANTRGQDKDPGSLGDSADTLDAVRYVLEIAERRGTPVVINLSEGDNIGPHDGTSLLEVGLANLIHGPGRALIKSAGNGGIAARHAAGLLTPGGSQAVQIAIPAGESEVMVDIWYPAGGRLALRLTPPLPGGVTTGVFQPPSSALSAALSNGNKAFVDADVNDPGNGDSRTFLVLRAGSQGAVQAGVWTLQMDGAGPWHAWIQLESGAAFRSPFATRDSTISIPGSSPAVITVGAYISNDLFSLGGAGALSDLSSRGPTRDGRRAPTLSAPGEEITAPQPPDRFAPFKGTSMSAAMVTGAVALMFETNAASTASDVRRCLEQTARRDALTGATPSNDWGAGKLDVEAACRCIR